MSAPCALAFAGESRRMLPGLPREHDCIRAELRSMCAVCMAGRG
jgi:hypothetical protein